MRQRLLEPEYWSGRRGGYTETALCEQTRPGGLAVGAVAAEWPAHSSRLRKQRQVFKRMAFHSGELVSACSRQFGEHISALQ
jgi:hypothetical protein